MDILEQSFNKIQLDQNLLSKLSIKFQGINEVPEEVIQTIPKLLMDTNDKISEADNIGNLLFLRADAKKRIEDLREEYSSLLPAYFQNEDLYKEISPEYAERLDRRVRGIFSTQMVARSVILITDFYLLRNDFPEEFVEIATDKFKTLV